VGSDEGGDDLQQRNIERIYFQIIIYHPLIILLLLIIVISIVYILNTIIQQKNSKVFGRK
jgi:hypothetical protein